MLSYPRNRNSIDARSQTIPRYKATATHAVSNSLKLSFIAFFGDFPSRLIEQRQGRYGNGGNFEDWGQVSRRVLGWQTPGCLSLLGER